MSGNRDFVVTGSRAYGPEKPTSDLDIVLVYDQVKRLEKYLEEHNILITRTPAQDDYAIGGFYFDLLNIRVNIVAAFNDRDLEAWRKATRKMQKLDPIVDKDARVDAFQSFFNGE